MFTLIWVLLHRLEEDVEQDVVGQHLGSRMRELVHSESWLGAVRGVALLLLLLSKDRVEGVGC